MACGAHTTLDHVEAIGARPIIPKRSQMTRARDFDPEKYKRRNMIERSIGKLKQLRRIATRYDRLSESCLACASTCFAGILVLNVATAWLFGHDGRRYRRRAMVICLQTKLIPFPGLPRPDIRIMANVQRDERDLLLNYYVGGRDADTIQLPERHPDPYGARRDGLWLQTCFEAFVRRAADPAYCEINISPSGDWAGYLFDRYREGRRAAPPIDGPYSAIWVERGLGIEIQATYDMSVVEELPPNEPWQLNLAAVIETLDGAKSWWALAHPDPAKPDFHHPDSFALTLPPPA